MKSFSQFNIQAVNKGFEGDKIKMSRILNREIVVHAFKIEDSKVYKGKCLCLQISFNNEKHIVFTSGSVLIDMIHKVPDSGFPFTTTIVEDNERFLFT